MADFNIAYPLKFGSNNSIKTNLVGSNNSSRINFIQAFKPLQRPSFPDYGTRLGVIEQSTDRSQIIDTIFQFKNLLIKYMNKYLIVESVQLSSVKDRSATVNVVYKTVYNA